MANSTCSTPEVEKKPIENGLGNDSEESSNSEKDPCLLSKEKYTSVEVINAKNDSDPTETKQLQTELKKNNRNSYKLTKRESGKKRNRLNNSKCGPTFADFEKNLESKTGLSRTGLIVAAIILLTLFILIIVIITLGLLWPITPHSQKYPMCKNPACLHTSAEILPKMDTNETNPCENFRRYSCGSWMQSTTLPKNKNEWGLKQRMQYITRDKIRRLISTMPHLTSGNSYHWKLKYFYDSCMAFDNIEAERDRHLTKIITDLGGWNVLRSFNMYDWDVEIVIKSLHAFYGVNLFFNIDVVPDPRDSQLDIIQISPPELGLPHRNYYYRPADSSVVQAYKRFLKDAAQTLGATSSNAESFSEEIFSYEKRIAEILPDTRNRDPFRTYNKMTIDELKTLAPSLQLKDILLAKFTEANIDDIMHVIVPYPEYLRDISAIKTSTDRSVLNNYALSQLAVAYLPYMSKQYRDTINIYRKDMFGENEPSPRWEFCISVLQKYMGYAVAALFQENAKNVDAGHNAVSRIFEDIRSSVLKSVRGASWINQNLRDHLLDKLNGLGLQVGFPEPFLRTTYIDEFYRSMHVQKHDFFQNVLYGVTFLQKYQQKRLKMPAEEHRWTDAMTSSDVSVSYVVETNKVIVPQAILTEPFFHPEYPMYVLYGNIGVEISSAIMEGLVPWKVMYAGDGTLLVTEHPAINQTSHDFRYVMECLRKFWNNAGYAKMNVSNRTGYNTLVAISAVKNALNALKMGLSFMPHIHQPALENYEDEQLFFITYTQAICSIKSAHKSDLDSTLDEHLDETALLPIILSQLDAFSDTFHCSTGDLLHISSTCSDIL
uniref:Peptidase M13 N-terminal domain-containing protein n=1 Tax=Clastoptera arizonana TaxID=38151 RepID=A0A1B6CAA0_9HEMI